MRYSDKTWPARTLRRTAVGLTVLALAGCAAAETPIPFIDSPGERAAAPQVPASAKAGRAEAPATRLAYPTFATPAIADNRPVLDAAAQAKMENDLQRLARERDRQISQQIEEPQ